MEEVIRSLIPAFIAFLAYHIYVLNGRIKTKDSTIEALKDHLQMANNHMQHDSKNYKVVKDRLEQRELEQKVLQQELEARGAVIQRIREALDEHR